MRSPHRGRRRGQTQRVCPRGGFLQHCLPVIFALLALSPRAPLAATGSASITTDQSEYLLGDTVIFTGAGYGSGEIVLMEVQRLDGTVYESWTVTASPTGTFTTEWPSTVNLYEGVVLEAAAEADPSGLVATTTFVLAPPAVSLEQMRNGAAGSPASPINWVNGNAGASNSHLTEKWSQAYRAVFTDLTAGDTIEFVVGYDITHSGKHAIDYLTYYDRINDPTHTSLYGHAQETIDPLLGVGALPGPVYAPIPPPPLSSCTLVVPNPPGPLQSQPCTSFDNLDNDPTQVRMTLYGGSFTVSTPVSYDAGGDPTQAQSEARVRVKFVAGGSTAVLLWGGHLASNTDWGAGNSAGGISGSPYHNRAIELRINGDLKNVGNQDRSLSAEAVAPCDVTITCPPNKTIACTESTDPSNTGTPSYTASNSCGTVTLTYHDAVSGVCPVTIQRTWVAMGSGGGDSCVQTITVVDTVKPTLAGCPSNVTVSCGAIPPPATVTATDNCDLSVAVVYSQTSSLSGCGGYTGTITRKWVATDDCGNKDSCVQTITVADTQAPSCNIGAGPFTFTQCAPAAVAIPVSATDNCDAAVTCAVVAGPGTVSGGNWTYTPSGDESFSVTIRCTDDCGNYCEQSFNVTFAINDPPVCATVSDTAYFQCAPAQVCRPVSATDPNGNLSGCAVVAGPGTVSGGNWCYTPSGDETVNVTIRCTDACGAYCEESFSVTFVINDAPVCSPIADTSYFQCVPTQVCRPYGSTDPNGNLTGCAIVSGPGTLSGGNWCYTPSGDETVNVTIRCTDACGAFCEESFSVTFQINDPPVVNLGNDISLPQTFPQNPVCFNYTVSDPNGLTGITETLVGAPGGTSFDTSLNQICFTPPGTGTYEFIVSATDPCGASDVDTLYVLISATQPPVCNLPGDTSVLQCAPTQICLPVSATGIHGPVTCAVTSGPGTVAGGQWCYTPVGDGAVTVTITCTDTLGVTCSGSFTVTVDINDAPVCSPIADTSYFQCAPTQVCRPYGSTDPNGNLTGCAIVSGPGTLSGGNWCYTPSGDETVNVTIRCTDACGAFCEESFSVTFVINDAPVCSPIADTSYFQCAPTQVCRPYGSTDPNGNLTGCAIVSGPGTLSGGNWCYTPTGDETVNVTIRCTDACGAFCEESFSVTFMIGMPPQIVCAPNANYTCATQVPPCSPSDVTVTGGAGTVTVVCQSSNNGGTGCPGNPLIYTYTYTATDSCGAQAQCVRTLTVIDNVAPTLSGCPTNVTIACNAPLPPPATVTAVDNCDPSVAVTLSETSNLTGCGGNTGTVTRVWTATDDCGNSASCTQVITIQDTQAPTCNIPSDSVIRLQCAPAKITVPVSATDNCDPAVICDVVAGPGTVIYGNWEYTPVSEGTFGVTIRCTDDCGNSCEGSFVVSVQFNDPPTIALGPDQSVFQCAPAPICVNYTVSDPNTTAGLTETLLSGPPGAVLNAGADQVCFTPSGAGAYTIIVRASDHCAATDVDTVVVNVSLNAPPTISFGPDLTRFLCAPAPLCIGYSASDPNGNALTEVLLSGPAGATLNAASDQVCFTPAASGNYTFIVRVQDTCGASDVDTVGVIVTLNLPPIAVGPNDTSLFQCAPAPLCLPVGGVDPEGRPLVISKINGPGTIAAGQWCYTPSGDETVNVTFRVTDSCGLFDDESFAVTFNLNSPPVCRAPNDTTIVMACSLRTVALPVSASDPDGGPVTCQVISGSGTIVDGIWSVTPSGPGNYCAVVRCTDPCGAVCEETFCVSVLVNNDDCNCLFKVSVNEGASINALNGQLVTVPVKFDLTGVPVGGFDLLLCYDASVISLVDVEKGFAIADWEYFTYRIGVAGNCTGSNCPSGMVRLVGIADMNNGAPVDPSAFLPVGAVADLSFVVTSDRNFIHQCIPIRFCWYDCADNTISSKSGDTTFLEISFVYDTCQSNPKGDPVPAICFENGRICIQEPPDDRGDINLNGIANEVGDAVLFTNYFLFGGTVWDPVWSQVQILATDVNDDGIVLTVADLIYLIRIITGDEQPFPPGGHPKMAPYAHTGTATLRREDGSVTVTTNAPVDIGGLLLVFRADGIGTGEPELLTASAGLNVRAHRDGSELRLLVHPSWSGGRTVIPSGRHDVLAIPTSGSGQLELVEVQMSDAQGALLSASATQAFVPGDYALMQNYPNPFNAGTVISFNLKDASDWTVTVYNVMGQTIRSFSGTADASTVNVEWNGQDANGTTVASGIYFYRVSTPAWSATKKMTLIR
ncbi:MAG TPA: T9SS type A sorting domain-containing protein [bacterium]|nr:T9SS type A sorting domain-containing protein [bacterium]